MRGGRSVHARVCACVRVEREEELSKPSGEPEREREREERGTTRVPGAEEAVGRTLAA